MILLRPDRAAGIRGRFLPDRPGPLVALHALHTGCGAHFADRWPEPRATLAISSANRSLAGDPVALDPGALTPLLQGLVDAPEAFVPLLREAAPDHGVWSRIVFALRGALRAPPETGCELRRLEASDAHRVWALSPEIDWIADTWGGPTGLAASGFAWGAFAKGRLAAVACSFFVGDGYEDVGVVTEPLHRGRGLSAACAAALARDIARRGRVPSWTTSPENEASLRVAEKLGFSLERDDVLYLVGQSVPASTRRPEPRVTPPPGAARGRS